jgi:hypothetical protein
MSLRLADILFLSVVSSSLNIFERYI